MYYFSLKNVFMQIIKSSYDTMKLIIQNTALNI